MSKTPWLLLALALAACANPKYQPPARESSSSASFASLASVDLTWEQQPTDTEPGSFRFQTYRTNPVDGTKAFADLGPDVGVLLWMPSMGHGSSPVTVERLDVGRYRATDVFFVMRGDWQIRIRIRNGSDVTDEAVLAYNF